ncbi:hypothetical protein KM043_002232 [Ampulex compressa]|nr:hypothetical protein KM043_002232 [Ampulex compressa]
MGVICGRGFITDKDTRAGRGERVVSTFLDVEMPRLEEKEEGASIVRRVVMKMTGMKRRNEVSEKEEGGGGGIRAGKGPNRSARKASTAAQIKQRNLGRAEEAILERDDREQVAGTRIFQLFHNIPGKRSVLQTGVWAIECGNSKGGETPLGPNGWLRGTSKRIENGAGGGFPGRLRGWRGGSSRSSCPGRLIVSRKYSDGWIPLITLGRFALLTSSFFHPFFRRPPSPYGPARDYIEAPGCILSAGLCLSEAAAGFCGNIGRLDACRARTLKLRS